MASSTRRSPPLRYTMLLLNNQDALLLLLLVLVRAGPAAIAPLPAMRAMRGDVRPPLQDDRHLHRGKKPLPILVVSS